MNTVKILHTADMHIGAAESFLGVAAQSRRYETLLTFEKICDLAVSEQVAIMIIAGDLFDSNRVEENFVDAVFNKISAIAPIKVVFAAGNHDPLNAESPFLTRNLPNNLFVLGTKDECITFEELNVCVYGRGFDNVYLRGEEKFSLAPSETRINIMAQHGELKSDLNSDYNAITPKFVKFSGMDYIALGHVHKKSDIGRIDNTYFAYCGCPEGQGFDELDEKGVYIGEIGKGICNLEFVSVSKRKHIFAKVDISGKEESVQISEHILNELKNTYGENFADNLYKIELTGEISADTEIVLSEIESRITPSLYFVKLKDATEYRVDLESLAKENTLKGVFVKNMCEKMKDMSEEEKALYKKALNLGLKAFTAEVKYIED